MSRERTISRLLGELYSAASSDPGVFVPMSTRRIKRLIALSSANTETANRAIMALDNSRAHRAGLRGKGVDGEPSAYKRGYAAFAKANQTVPVYAGAAVDDNPSKGSLYYLTNGDTYFLTPEERKGTPVPNWIWDFAECDGGCDVGHCKAPSHRLLVKGQAT